MRWAEKTRESSPFKCDECSDKDKEARNCFNRLGLSDEARAVTEYTDEIKAELEDKDAKKVFSLKDIRLYECPLSYLAEETFEIMRIVFMVETSGHLLYAGGWADQPAWLVEAWEIYKIEASRLVRQALKEKHG